MWPRCLGLRYREKNGCCGWREVIGKAVTVIVQAVAEFGGGAAGLGVALGTGLVGRADRIARYQALSETNRTRVAQVGKVLVGRAVTVVVQTVALVVRIGSGKRVTGIYQLPALALQKARVSVARAYAAGRL